MRKFKIHPDVACCAYKSGVLHDKEREYPEIMWEPGEAIQRVKRGFLVEVKPDPPQKKQQSPQGQTKQN